MNGIPIGWIIFFAFLLVLLLSGGITGIIGACFPARQSEDEEQS